MAHSNPKRKRVEGAPLAGASGYSAQHSDQGPRIDTGNVLILSILFILSDSTDPSLVRNRPDVPDVVDGRSVSLFRC
jgi:hypothetical protein